MKKNFRKTLSIVLCIVMLMSTFVIGITASAATVSSGTCGENLTWTLDDEGTLTISGTGDMKDYYSQGSPWYDNDNIKNVVIDNGVTSIGVYTFYYCTRLTNITIPASVTSIGDFAFYKCTRLTNITIPDRVTSIGYKTFAFCDSLTSITIPDRVTSIGDYAFWGCTSLTNITIPDSVTSIGNFVFYGCSSLKSITIPEGVTSIGERAFEDCTSLENITIPDSVTSIGYGAFRDCTSLVNITIPDSVTSISGGVFNGCLSLKSIIISNSLTSIGEYVFYKCTNLTNITIPDSVTSIGDYAFYNCKSLTSITIPESVTSIGSDAFAFCDSLTSITIPNSVTSIGWGAFYGYPKDMVLFGYVGSCAESYASEHDIIFVFIDNVPYVTLHCPVITDNEKFIAYGAANINSTVSVYSDGILLGNVKADAYGKWRGEFKLGSLVNNKSYDIRAEVKIDDKTASSEKTLKYNIDAIYPTKFTLTNSNTTIDCLDARVKNLSVVPSCPFKFEIKTNKTVSSLNVIAIKNGVTKRIKATYNSKENIWLATGFFDDSNHSFIPKKIGIEADGKALDFECATINFLIDPSGYVYEAVKSNRVEGASAIICYQDGEVAIPWDANKYEQENPQVTDEQGAYHWDVTEGTWRVKVTKTGYKSSYSDWMTVPPEYTEVAIPLITTEAPKVESVVREDNVITVTFSQYMDIDSVNIDNISVTANDNNILDSINAVNAEVSGTNEIVYYAKTFELIIDKNTGSKYTLTIDDVENYAGIYLYEEYVLSSEENNTPIEHEHRYDEKLTKAPLCTENGIKTFVCSICSDSYDKIIPALGHKDTNKDGICDTCNEVIDISLANPCRNAKINVASAKSVDYKAQVTIKATATGVPSNYYLAIYVNGKQVAKGSNTEVTYTVGQATSDINYTVKVIDAKGNVQKDATNKDLAKDGGKITVNSSFFAKIIAFFRGLFGLLPTVDVKP